MSSSLELAGAHSNKPTRFAPIWTAKFWTGFVSQRNPLGSAGSFYESHFYGQRTDALIGGSNIEISNRLTPIRRPGNSVYNSASFSNVDLFYDFRLSNPGEQIKVIVDTSATLYDGTGPSTQNTIWTKSAGAGLTTPLGVGNTLFFGNGVDQKKWVQTLTTWIASTAYSLNNGFPNTFFIDPNGNIQQLTSCIVPVTQVQFVSATKVVTITSNATNLTSVLTVGQQFVPNVGTATFINGQTLTILTVGASSFTASSTISHANYGPTADTGYGTIVQGGNPFSGTSAPAWNVTVGGTTNDVTGGGTAQWTNRGLPIENWGIAAPTIAPTYTVGASSSGWQAFTFYSNPQVIVDSNGGLQLVTTAGKSGTSAPPWQAAGSGVNTTTSDGTVTWTKIQTAASLTWASHTTYTPTVVGPYSTPSFVIGSAAGQNCLFQLQPFTLPSIQQQGASPIPNMSTNDYVRLYFWTTSGNVGIFSPYGASAGSATSTVAVNSLLFNVPGDPNATSQNFTLNTSGEVTGQTTPFGQKQNYSMVALCTINIPVAGQYTIQINHDDGMFFGMSGGVQYKSGPTNTFHLTTSLNGYPVLGGIDQNGNYQDTYVLVFPTAGTYNMEIDYFQWENENTLSVQFNGYTPIPLASGAVPQSMTNQPVWPSWNTTLAPAYPTVTEASTYNGPYGTYTPTGGALTWRNLGPVDPAGVTGDFFWHSKTQFLTPSGSKIIDPNNNVEDPYEAGATGATIPSIWATGTNQTTKDNPNLLWINQGPSSQPGAGTLSTFNGGWQYCLCLVNTLTNTVSNAGTLTAATGNHIGFSGVTFPAGAGLPNTIDPQVDYVAIFRTKDGGPTPFLIPGTGNSIYTIPLATYQATGYTDTTPDTGLNILLSPPLNGEQTPPATGAANLAYHLDRIFFSVANTVYWTAGPVAPVGNGVEGVPPVNNATFPSLVKRIIPTATGAIVFTVSDIYMLSGNGTAQSPIFPIPYVPGVGILSYNGIHQNGTIIGMFTSDSQFLIMDPSSGFSQTGFPIGDQLEQSNWNPANAYVTWHVSGSQDQAWYLSDGATGWYRLNPAAAPESGQIWAPFATITNGVKAVQSIEVSPGVHKLLLGPTGSGNILKRDLTTNADNGTAYTAYGIIGSIVLANPGQIAEVESIIVDSMATGTRPSISVLMDEISGTFNSIEHYEDDPAQLPPSATTYNQRFYVMDVANDVPALCRHMQIRWDWPAENAANEILSMTIMGGIAAEK